MKLKTVGVMLAGALLLGACMQMPELPTSESSEQQPSAAVAEEVLNLQIPVATEKEQIWYSSDYQGKPILIAFMATWCPWCKRSLPALEETSQAYKNQVEVVGVFVEDDIAAVNKVVKDFNVQSKILYNGGEAAQKFEVTGFPHIMLFDKNHKLVRTWSGYSDRLADEYAKEIDKLLK